MANPSDADPRGTASGSVPPDTQARPQDTAPGIERGAPTELPAKINRDIAQDDDASVPAPTSASKAAPEEERVLARADRRASSNAPGMDLHGMHVLAVDDDLEMLGLLRAILEGAGAKVTTVTTATAALQTLNLLRPDVLVADLGMPVMDGFSLIHRVRHASDPHVRNIATVAVTGRAESEDRAMVLDSGFEVHLGKPVDPAELVAAVAALVRRTKR